jgi:hypothetical protein
MSPKVAGKLPVNFIAGLPLKSGAPCLRRLLSAADDVAGSHIRGRLRQLIHTDRTSVYLQRRLLSVLKAAVVRPTSRLRRFDPVTCALRILNWLRVPEGVDYKLAVSAYCVLNGLAHKYSLNVVTGVAIPADRMSTLDRRRS